MKKHRTCFVKKDDNAALVREFGTYNIQPTADTDNAFPAIAQGLPRSLNNASDLNANENRAP